MSARLLRHSFAQQSRTQCSVPRIRPFTHVFWYLVQLIFLRATIFCSHIFTWSVLCVASCACQASQLASLLSAIAWQVLHTTLSLAQARPHDVEHLPSIHHQYIDIYCMVTAQQKRTFHSNNEIRPLPRRRHLHSISTCLTSLQQVTVPFPFSRCLHDVTTGLRADQ